MDLSEQSERMQSYYDLAHDPFGAIVDSMVFSGAGGRYETAETLRHLLTYSQQDSQLVGANGAGKRMLAQQVIKMLDESWRVAWVDAAEIESLKALEKELIGQLGLGLKADEDTATLLKRINAVVAQRYEQEEAFLLVVQRADLASPEVIQMLRALRQQVENPDHRIRQLWLVENDEFVVDDGEVDWYRHELDPLSDSDAEQYVRDRMIAAGYVDDLPIPATDISRLNQLSGGMPLQLNELARDYLISSTFKTTEKKQAFPITHVIAGIAALSLVTIAFLYQTGESNGDEATIVVESTSNDRPLSSVEQRLADAVAQVEARQQGDQRAGNQDSATQIDDTVAGSEDTPTQSSEPIEESSVDAVVESEPETEVAQSDESSLPSLLERGADQQLTVQLIGVRDRAQLVALVDRFSNPESVDILETTYQGAPWFVLIYGQFDTRADAQTAFENLPEGLFTGDPWIRTFLSLRDSL